MAVLFCQVFFFKLFDRLSYLVELLADGFRASEFTVNHVRNLFDHLTHRTTVHIIKYHYAFRVFVA